MGGSDVFGKRGRQQLLHALEGHYDDLSEEQQAAFATISSVQRQVLASHLSTIDHYRELINALDVTIARRLVQELEEVAGDQDVRLLATIPGLGLLGAAVVKAEIGTIERFPSGKHLSSYAGCVPRIEQSGTTDKKGGIVRANSNRRLRTALFRAAAVCARYGPAPLQAFHRRLRAKRGSYKLATIALARRLLVIIWLMLQEGVPFSSAFNSDLAERKKKRLAQELKRLVKLEKKYGDAETLFKMIQNLHHKEE